jgi:hypothetical protein
MDAGSDERHGASLSPFENGPVPGELVDRSAAPFSLTNTAAHVIYSAHYDLWIDTYAVVFNSLWHI